MLFAPAFLGAAACVFPRAPRGLPLALCAVSCIAGVAAFPMFLLYGDISAVLPMPSVWGFYGILVDRPSAIMMSVSSAVFLMTVIHMRGSGASARGPAYTGLVNLLFAACTLAMCADNVLLLLVSWEAVSVCTFLMASGGGSGEAARWRFLVITHFGGLMIVAAFLSMYLAAGTPVLSEWSGLSSVLGPAGSVAAAALLFPGTIAKLGRVPFHAWMPDLYAGAPTHTTVLLTTVCSNAAVLLLIKGLFGFIGDGPEVFGLSFMLVALSCATALWGALESLIQREPKRILAYSSMENMALVMLCVSLAMMFGSSGSPELSVLPLTAAFLHTVNHSLFKSLMLMAVGTAEESTGETSIERMGGLALRLRILSVTALAATASLAAIPPFNGFASEWLMLQSMVEADGLAAGISFILPFGVAVLGICGAMAAVSYARLYGFMFLGRPRSPGAESPAPVSRWTLAPMAVLAAACLAVGLLALPVCDQISAAAASIAGLPPGTSYREHLSGAFEPLALFALGGVILIAVAVVSRIRRRPAVTAGTWDCGTPLDSGMQYSSAGFSQPLVRVFHPLYGDLTETREDGADGGKTYKVVFSEPFVKDLFVPLGRAVMLAARAVGRIQTGNIQSYLAYILIVLVSVLMAVRLF